MEKEGAEDSFSISAWYDDGHPSPGNTNGRFEMTPINGNVIGRFS